MIGTIYVYENMDCKKPSNVISRMKELGYTNIQGFDVEYGQYEVEATTPAADEVELEIDPITGAVLDIDENWF